MDRRPADPDSSRRIPELDGVRGLACLLVLGWHYFGATLPSGAGAAGNFVAWLGPIGLSGVDLFFVLSGFLIGGILCDHRDSPRYFRTFYTRRVCRIFPVYYGVIAALLLALAFGLPARFPAMNQWLLKDLQPLWSYATFTQNFHMAADGQAGGKWLAMTWSVAVEEQFYLLFPFVVRWLPLRALPYLLCAGVAAAPFFRELATAGGWWFYTLLPCRFDCLGVGVLAAIAVRRPAAREWLRERKAVLPAAMLASLAGYHWVPQFHLTHSWIALFYGSLLLLVVLRPERPPAGFFRSRTLAAVGLVSYGMYMFHQPVNGLVHAAFRSQAPTLANGSDLAATLLSAGLTVGLALLSYHAVEKRVIALGHRAKW